MLISIVLIAAAAFGGLVATYLIFDDARVLFRLAAGNVIGAAIMGTAAFALACLFGLNTATASLSLLAAAAPALLLVRQDIRSHFNADRKRALALLQNGSKRFGGFAFYLFFFILFCLFFSQAMYQTGEGIFTGGSQNLGDLPFHLGAILGFTDGANFPPQNPSFAGARFSYPFIADLLTAVLMKFGASVENAIVVQDVSWAFSLLVIVESFVGRVSGSKLAGRLAPWLLFFTGGLGFVWFLKDYSHQGKGLIDLLYSLPGDYTITDRFRWGNSMVVLFITQRSILLGMPLTTLIIEKLWSRFLGEEAPDRRNTIAMFIFGLIAGTLPLIHLHSLFVLFVVSGFCLALRPAKWRDWAAFGIGTCVVAIPELIWSIIGSASESSKFFDWNFGWDKGDANVFWFWLLNTGLAIPMIAGGIYLLYRQKNADERPRAMEILKFYLPFAFLFVLANVAKLAPWQWDNIKVLIYWFVGSLPLICYALAWSWHRGAVLKIAAAAVFLSLIAAGALDVFRTADGQNKIKVFDSDAVKLADIVKAKVPANAVFLNAPTYNSAAVLTGRLSFMRYTGHLSSHGIDFAERESDLKTIYQGGGMADVLLKRDHIDYVLVSPIEINDLHANEQYFAKFPVVAESGQYRVYQVK